MKFDPLNWGPIQEGKDYAAKNGRVLLRASQKIAVYIAVEGVEALAGVGFEVDAAVSPGATFRCEAVADTPSAIFAYDRAAANFTPQGEVFSNADRKPMESGMLAEVTKAMRELKIQQHVMRKEMAIERQKILSAQRRALKPDGSPEVVEPEPGTAETEQSEGGETPAE